LSLLEHHFTDPDAVRIAIRAPGQITSMTIKPAEKAFWNATAEGRRKELVSLAGSLHGSCKVRLSSLTPSNGYTSGWKA
jgi:hypothetical protein